MIYKGRAEVNMPLRYFRRQYEQLSQFERGIIIGRMEAGWSAKRVARQLGHSDCVRPRVECLNPALALQRHTTPTAGVMVWVAIAYNTRSVTPSIDLWHHTRQPSVPLRLGGTLNSRRAANPVKRFVEEAQRCETPDHLQGFLSQNWGGTDLNRTVICRVIKATVNDKRTSSPLPRRISWVSISHRQTGDINNVNNTIWK
ncbi:uncharacterized protein TNCV_3683371 [Trichonephila clavipes]|nr:uncharacterized protein TNCV_3683371 [Trichonephila clavipes]